MNARERLELAIRTSGLSQAECARRAGMKPQHLNAYLKGKYEVNRSFPDLAKVFNVPVEWLMTGAGDPPWWADPARAVVVNVPYQSPPPPAQGPKPAEEQAADDRVLAALYKAEERAAKMEAKLDALLERMLPPDKPAPGKWTAPRRKVGVDG